MILDGFRPRFSFALLLASSFSFGASAATLRLQPVADTTLIETAPDNNMGGTWFVNAGTAGAVGLRNRGLYKFDFSSIPPHSRIASVAVTLEVTKEPDNGGQFSSFALHRLYKAWGEGDKNSTDEGSPGLGFPATANEATWNSRFAFTTNAWSVPGASNDFAAEISSSTFVYGVASSPYTFNSTARMVADVQMWVDDPTTNFGWLLKSESEAEQKTARRFGSREFVGGDTNSPPYVEVEFFPALTILNPQITNGQFQFSFLAESNQAYTVEMQTGLSTNSWLALTNIAPLSEPASISITDSISTNARFYRVVTP